MKNITKLVILISILTILLAGCAASVKDPTIVTRGSFAADITEPTTEEPTEPSTEEITTEPPTFPTEPPAPEHSDLYIPDLDVEDVITYFNEVCLDAEYTDGGEADLLQRWETTIYYQLNGVYTEEDLITFENMVAWLNNLEGFPGIVPSSEPDAANLNIYFCSEEELITQMGENYVGADGAVTFWYTDNVIHDEIICYRNDINQYTRNSVILEEIYNGLGPAQDTALRSDSLIYSEFSEPQWMSEIDELILKLLYHPSMQPGMNADECAEVIRELYY